MVGRGGGGGDDGGGVEVGEIYLSWQRRVESSWMGIGRVDWT